MTASGSNAKEIDARVAAAWRGWHAHKRVLTSARFSLRQRMLIFRTMVLSALYSGLEPRVLRPAEADRLTKFLCARLRAVLRGRAHTEFHDGTHRAWTNVQVLTYCKCLPAHLDLAARRIKWLAAMALSLIHI